jgi:hypothetical protein
MNYETFFTEGKRGSLVAVDVYPNGVVSASAERLTATKFQRTLCREFPGVTFSVKTERGYHVAREVRRAA